MANYGPYRKAHRDYSSIRVAAVSTIVIGLLLGTAPMALAQVGVILTSIPATFTEEAPTLAASSTGIPDVERDNAQTSVTVEHRLKSPVSPVLISWNGTGQALRCSYGLLLQGNIRSCQAA